MPSVIPEHSRLAWEETLAVIVGTNAVHRVAEMSDLALSACPGFERVLSVEPETWVPLYEQALETLNRQARRQGQVQTGVFYTPAHVARYLVQQSLGERLQQARRDIRQAMDAGRSEQAQVILDTVRQLKIVDPACGTGTFLMESLKALHDFYGAIAADYPAFTIPQAAQLAIKHQLFGVDIDPLSAWITEARLSQWACKLDKTPTGFDVQAPARTIRCGDALAVPVDIAASSPHADNDLETISATFCWETAFPSVGAWDFILGNPPYLSEVRKQSARFRPLRQSPYYQAKMDLCDAFLAWALDHLAPAGQLAYVLPEYWTQRTATTALRRRVWREGEIRELWTFPDQPLFPNAPGHHSALLLWQKNARVQAESQSPQAIQLGIGYDATLLSNQQLRPAAAFLDPVSDKLLFGETVEIALLSQLSVMLPLLSPSEIQQGVVLPQGRLRRADRNRLPAELAASLPEEAGLFLLTDAEVDALQFNEAERGMLKPYYPPAGFAAFMGFADVQPMYRLIYTDVRHRQKIAAHPERYPQLKAHLDAMQPINTSGFGPYGVHRARQPVWFEDARKIFSPRQVMRPSFAVVDFPAYVGEGFYSLRPARWDPHAVTALLNSRLAWFWFYKQKRKGHRLQIDKDVLCAFPVPPDCSAEDQHALAMVAKSLALPLSAAEREKQMQVLDTLIYRLYGLSDSMISAVRNWQPAAP